MTWMTFLLQFHLFSCKWLNALLYKGLCPCYLAQCVGLKAMGFLSIAHELYQQTHRAGISFEPINCFRRYGCFLYVSVSVGKSTYAYVVPFHGRFSFRESMCVCMTVCKVRRWWVCGRPSSPVPLMLTAFSCLLWNTGGDSTVALYCPKPVDTAAS